MTTHAVWRVLLGIGVSVAARAAPLAAQDAEAGIPLGATPSAVTLQGLDSQPVALARLIGDKPALIEFWATWCPVCRALEPKLKAAHARFGARVQFLAVAVAVNETPAGIKRHLAARPLPFPVVWDANGSAVRAFQAPSTSYIVVLDRHGRVAYTGVGADQDLAAALARVTGTPS